MSRTLWNTVGQVVDNLVADDLRKHTELIAKLEVGGIYMRAQLDSLLTRSTVLEAQIKAIELHNTARTAASIEKDKVQASKKTWVKDVVMALLGGIVAVGVAVASGMVK